MCVVQESSAQRLVNYREAEVGPNKEGFPSIPVSINGCWGEMVLSLPEYQECGW